MKLSLILTRTASHIYQKVSDTLEGVKFTKSGKVVTLTDDYEADKFDVADFGNYKNKIVTINAAKVPHDLGIVGNKKSNVITGTGTDDYIDGGGHDYIDDYEQVVDKIMILSSEKPYIDRTNLSNNVTYIIGEGSLVVKNGINTTIEFVDSNNRLIDKSTPSTAG